MSKQSSVYQKGGGGTNFEQTVQTTFLTSLIIGGKAFINEDISIIEIAL